MQKITVEEFQTLYYVGFINTVRFIPDADYYPPTSISIDRPILIGDIFCDISYRLVTEIIKDSETESTLQTVRKLCYDYYICTETDNRMTFEYIFHKILLNEKDEKYIFSVKPENMSYLMVNSHKKLRKLQDFLEKTGARKPPKTYHIPCANIRLSKKEKD